MAEGLGINKRTITMIIAVGVVVIILLWTVLAYNGMVGKDQNVNNRVSEIKNRYTTKVNVLGQLLPQVQQYQQFESSTLSNITKLRSQWSDAVANGSSTSQLIDISSQIDTNFVNVRATYEAYPTLFSGTLVQQYMGEIVNQEESLSYSRSQYNNAVRDYNTAIKSFPNIILSGTFGFNERPYWGTEMSDGQILNT
jgi:LemA protein